MFWAHALFFLLPNPPSHLQLGRQLDAVLGRQGGDSGGRDEGEDEGGLHGCGKWGEEKGGLCGKGVVKVAGERVAKRGECTQTATRCRAVPPPTRIVGMHCGRLWGWCGAGGAGEAHCRKPSRHTNVASVGAPVSGAASALVDRPDGQRALRESQVAPGGKGGGEGATRHKPLTGREKEKEQCVEGATGPHSPFRRLGATLPRPPRAVSAMATTPANAYRALRRALRDAAGPAAAAVLAPHLSAVARATPNPDAARAAAADWAALVDAVTKHADLLASYGVGVDRESDQKRMVEKTAARVGLRVPDGASS